ncbi:MULTISPECIES: choline ABC transporter permease OpuBD [Bacillus]|jgi:osmoprotectant transport system permease protein|uniref:Choline transport system permease protein OpuBD n=4 Tax=Bacillus subtilis TaxID=1423 RepID=OPUBD_BACSU|nr:MULTISPECIES: choline ABC transporter permease OpuBD [Bacillales]NP_391250.1 choline ABC transporter (permease) [Bacillus subtilis subsp. subtilis str. 168]P39775.3 RecName: Full=Choline transport system permease protein OpuBD [Bacillus subtilis subsp. subtilis str. 168]MDP4113671.1 choline ABC transporter permease OpuBD [Bacillota bacterium]CJR55000.1 Osmotically activated L-carnitine/choline ABC transporter permease OpuCD [Streptococcus pneumoniae]BAM55448.1 choline ABC transporter permea
MNVLEQLMTYYAQNGSYVMDEFGRHFLMSAYGVLFAAVVGVPAGILIAHFRRLSAWVFAVTNVIQTIPALAMLAVLMLVMGLGANTVILSLFLYSLLPIIRNTYTGIISIEHAYLESGKAMGMTKFQVLRMVELPLALSVIMAGLRTALVIAIGITAIGTFVGAGGLGDMIVRGSNATNGTAIILAGAIPTAVMAVGADLLMAWLERALSPVKKKRTGAKHVQSAA